MNRIDRIAMIGSVAVILMWGVALASASVATAPSGQAPGLAEADGWLTFVVTKLMTVHGLGASLAGLMISFALTQWLKMSFPAGWDEKRRDMITRGVAFFAAAIPTLIIWPMTFDWGRFHDPHYLYNVIGSGLIMAVLLGAISPILYLLTMRYAYSKGWLDPSVWSGSARAEPPDAH